jgi:hypothetical protein
MSRLFFVAVVLLAGCPSGSKRAPGTPDAHVASTDAGAPKCSVLTQGRGRYSTSSGGFANCPVGSAFATLGSCSGCIDQGCAVSCCSDADCAHPATITKFEAPRNVLPRACQWPGGDAPKCLLPAGICDPRSTKPVLGYTTACQ